MIAEPTEGPDAIEALPPRQRAALALIGVTNEKQLVAADGIRLWDELQKAFQLFPDEPTLTPEEWERTILPLLRGQAPNDAQPAPTPLSAAQPPIANAPFDTVRTRPLPILAHRKSSSEMSDHGEQGMLPFRRRHKKGIRHQHAFRTVLIAFTVLLFYACLAGIGAWLVNVFFYAPSHKLQNFPILVALMAGVLPFVLFGWMSKCSVCNISLFSWKRYRRNRHCHHIPLLGYQLPTAFHILFFFWFRCPSCGTPQELRRK